MQKLTKFSVSYPVTIVMMVLGVILLGVISLGKLGVDLFPDLNNPKIFVEISAGERPPEEMEKQFVENIEAIAIRQSDVLDVSSVCKVGSAQITVSYSWDKDMDEAFLDLQKALNSYGQNTEIDDLAITQHDPNTSPVILVGMSHSSIDDMNELRKVAENYIRNELVRLEGVAEVDLAGEEENEVQIKTDQYKLDAYNLSLSQLSQTIQNFNRNVSGGRINELGLQYIIKGVSILKDVEDFENIIVGYKAVQTNLGGGQDNTATKSPVFLREVADVEIVNKEPDNIVRLNGKRCIGLSVYKETKYNTVRAVEEIAKELASIEKALPGYHFTVITNQGNFIKNAVGEVQNTALIGIVLAVFVLFLFLRRFGATLIVAASIPISIVATFNLMYFNGLTMNIMTLGGLALGAGMLVDNAIVVIENIFRNHENGMSVKEAAIKGTAQVGGAITASTLTTIIVFLPIVYLHGASGELFKDQAWTVAFSLVSSLFVAIFFIPMIYNLIYRKKAAPAKKSSVQMTGYGKILKALLARKGMIIFVALLLVVGAGFMVKLIGTEFMPKTESKEFNLELKMPEGTEIERTVDAVSNLETLIKELLGEHVMTIYSHTGPKTGISGDAGSIFEGENTASLKVMLKPESNLLAGDAINALDELTSGIEGVEINLTEEESALRSILGTDVAPVVIEVIGDDLEIIEGIVQSVRDTLAGIPELYNIQTSIENGAPEIEVNVDRLRAGMYNLEVSSIVSQIKNQLEGTSAGQLDKDGEMSDITLKLPEKGLVEFGDLVLESGGQVIRVDEVAEIVHSVSPKEIYRNNQNRVGKIYAQKDKAVALQHISSKIEEQLSKISLPNNYKIKITGEEEKRQESMANLSFAILLSIVLVYMVLASQFESLLHPFTILLTIPLAVVGAIFIFFLLGKSLNIMAYMGIIMLVGIAVNDSIILVDRINQLKQEGYQRLEAILLAGQQRIRPILMTSLTTMLALLPLTFGFGESASLRSPMALAVIGGLVTSTLLTLVVIPCVYDVFDRIKDKFSRDDD
ncbi:efflux RND transporter permease subunit [Puteibacter caeruleilacunae]|nr:efflux RND transporter permease subunit [Puteibacter caeruleilacunae]